MASLCQKDGGAGHYISGPTQSSARLKTISSFTVNQPNRLFGPTVDDPELSRNFLALHSVFGRLACSSLSALQYSYRHVDISCLLARHTRSPVLNPPMGNGTSLAACIACYRRF